MRLLTLLLLCTAAWGVEPANYCALTEQGCDQVFDVRRGMRSWNGGNKHLPTVLGWYVDKSIPAEFRAPIERARRHTLEYTHNVYFVPAAEPTERSIRWYMVDRSQMFHVDALAEAFLPNAESAGLIRFSAAKDWRKYDVFSVAIHELGHSAFSLLHALRTYDPSSPWYGVTPVMYPGYFLHVKGWTPLDVRAMGKVVNIRFHAFQWRIH